MEFVDVMKLVHRIYKTHVDVDGCGACELNMLYGCMLNERHANPAVIEEIAVRWGQEHPEKTRVQMFIEKYPDALLGGDGYPLICVEHLGYQRTRDCCPDNCMKCWNMSVEE